METILRGTSVEVTIKPDGPVTMIGEKINPTGRKSLAAALKSRDLEHIRELALRQVAAGAQVLDINVSVPGLDEADLLAEIVQVVAAHVSVPLCLDSNDPKALEAALAVTPGKCLVNSVNGEEARLARILPLIKERGVAVIGLTMDEKGIPNDPETRLAIAHKIVERAVKAGIPQEDVLIDPLVLTVGADQNAGKVTLRAIELICKELGVNVNLGASNVSFGLPERQLINQAFLALAAGAGASCVITDPEKLAPSILAIDLLLGKDPYGKRFLRHLRGIAGAGAAKQ